MTFRHGRKASVWVNALDLSTYLDSIDLDVKVKEAIASTFQANWDSYFSGVAGTVIQAHGYYDPTQLTILNTMQVDDGILTYGPAGLINVGDLARLVMFDSTNRKEAGPVGGLANFNWSATSDKVVGFGTCIAPIASQGVGTINGTGDGVMTAAQSTTGAVAHLHVTAMTGGDTQNFKLQDATVIGGPYADIASGAFPAITAVGGYRLVVPGTIRAYVRVVATIAGHACTYGVAVART